MVGFGQEINWALVLKCMSYTCINDNDAVDLGIELRRRSSSHVPNK